MLKKTFNLIVDPIDKTSLSLVNSIESKKHILTGTLKNTKGNSYSINDGIVNLIPDNERMHLNNSSLKVWEKLQEQGNELYTKFPQLNLSTSDRKDVKQFAKFSEFTGIVLDVGCGPKIPSYLINKDIDLAIGIDPLVSINNDLTNDKIDLLKAIGEFVPFKNGSFDFVCFATSFDHVLEPIKVLNESKRVLKKDGFLVLWTNAEPKKRGLATRAIIKAKRMLFTEIRNDAQNSHDKYMLLIQEEEKLLQSMEIPSGAVDKFHLRHIPFKELDDQCKSLNFKQIEKQELNDNLSLFVKYQID